MIIGAFIVLLFCLASSIDTNRYIDSHYPDDKKLNSLKAPQIGIAIAMVLLVLSYFS